MTKKVFFDTDCISSFMRIGERNVIEELFNARIVIPEEVYEELSNPRVPHLKKQVDEMIVNGFAVVQPIEVGSSEYIIFNKLTDPLNKPIIGRGEGAAIAQAYISSGILASNNLRDVKKYVEEYNLAHYTTLDILILAEEQGVLCDLECESIWRAMKQNGITLPEGSYQEHKKAKQKNKISASEHARRKISEQISNN